MLLNQVLNEPGLADPAPGPGAATPWPRELMGDSDYCYKPLRV